MHFKLFFWLMSCGVVCCHLQDVAAVLDGAIAEVVDSVVSEVAHTCASYVSTALE